MRLHTRHRAVYAAEVILELCFLHMFDLVTLVAGDEHHATLWTYPPLAGIPVPSTSPILEA